MSAIDDGDLSPSRSGGERSGAVRLIKHEAVPGCDYYKVKYRPSHYFYWDDLARRRLDPYTLSSEQASS